MRMKKSGIISVLTVLSLAAAVMLAGCGSSSSGAAEWPAMDKLKGMDPDEIKSVDFQRLTEGGSYMDSVYDGAAIEDIYLRLVNVKAGDETEEDVLDDSLNITVKTEDTELAFSFAGDILILEDGTRYKVEDLGTLRSYIDQLTEDMNAADSSGGPGSSGQDSGQSAGQNSGQGTGQSTASTGGYDIMKNFQKRADGSIVYLYFNDFMLTMPNNEKYSFEASSDKQSVTFYLFSAQQEGYGGKLVTIKAYDLDDASYEELPSYHVAGVGGNVNKRFIAIYPTDVQWNGNDSLQDADYRDLADHLKKIGEGAVNSPLATADSNPEP